MIEKKDVHIIDLNSCFKQLVHFLELYAENLEDLLIGELHPFGDNCAIREDTAYHISISPCSLASNYHVLEEKPWRCRCQHARCLSDRIIVDPE